MWKRTAEPDNSIAMIDAEEPEVTVENGSEYRDYDAEVTIGENHRISGWEEASEAETALYTSFIVLGALILL